MTRIFALPFAHNPAWTAKALRGSSPIPAGAEVWLPQGTLERRAAAGKKAKAPPAVEAADASAAAALRP